MVAGGVHGCRGACVVAGGHVWLQGVCMAAGGACMVAGGHAWLQRGGQPQGGVWLQGVSCDLSHHAFDVTCMLPPHQLSVSTCAAPYIV